MLGMTVILDNRASKQWDKACISYNNYQEYLKAKSDRFELTLIDLLYISNFKGGNATINENEAEINKKLGKYSDILKLINHSFALRSISSLLDDECENLLFLIEAAFDLVRTNSIYKIDGFSFSYISALLNAYFPNLVPILDRRLLINLKLVNSSNVDSQGQIKNIPFFYKNLFYKTRELMRGNSCSLRELDRIIFIQKIISDKN